MKIVNFIKKLWAANEQHHVVIPGQILGMDQHYMGPLSMYSDFESPAGLRGEI